MVSVVEACAECTQNCNLMHEKLKDPDPVPKTFFKVMIGDNFSEVLFLPPRFARSKQNMVGEETRLEDSTGEKWMVKFSRVDGLLAFQEGWNKFSSDHCLKVGDFLVFHYVMGSHFVVSMYGPSGCPENRHLGFTRPQKKKIRKNGKVIADDNRTSNENTDGHHHSNASSFRSGSSASKKKKMRTEEKLIVDDNSPSNVNNTDDHHHLIASSSQSEDKETSQRSEPLVTDTSPHFGNGGEKVNMVSETSKSVEPLIMVVPAAPSPCVVEPFCLVDRDTGNVEEESRRSCLHDLSSFEIPENQPDGGGKNELTVGGGEASGYERGEYRSGLLDLSSENQKNESVNVLETRFKEPAESQKKSAAMPNEDTCRNSIKRRLRNACSPIEKTERAKKKLAGTSDVEDVVEASHAKMMEMAKKELTTAGTSDKNDAVEAPHAEPMGTTEKELTMTHGLDNLNEPFYGYKSKDTKTGGHSSLSSPKKEDDIFLNVKPEPVDFDEEPSLHVANAMFSAVMESYQYLVRVSSTPNLHAYI